MQIFNFSSMHAIHLEIEWLPRSLKFISLLKSRFGVQITLQTFINTNV